MIADQELTIASVYVPKTAQASFFFSFFAALEPFHSPHMYIGGTLI